MTTEKTMEKVSQAENNVVQEQAQAQSLKLRPNADIYENKEGAVIYVDLPGVSQERLDINVDRNVLSINADIDLNTPADLKPTYMDVRAGKYSRQFTLSSELDNDKIDAKLKDGVLKLVIPRSEKHKPRKIEVKVA